MERNDRTEVGQTDLLSAALEYAQRGLPVFPLEPKTKRPLAPLASNGVKNASTDRTTMERWWTQEPDANIGIACTDLLVVNVDPRNDGDKAIEGLAVPYGPMPPCFVKMSVLPHTGDVDAGWPETLSLLELYRPIHVMALGELTLVANIILDDSWTVETTVTESIFDPPAGCLIPTEPEPTELVACRTTTCGCRSTSTQGDRDE